MPSRGERPAWGPPGPKNLLISLSHDRTTSWECAGISLGLRTAELRRESGVVPPCERPVAVSPGTVLTSGPGDRGRRATDASRRGAACTSLVRAPTGVHRGPVRANQTAPATPARCRLPALLSARAHSAFTQI